jgi:hypothetical protein
VQDGYRYETVASSSQSLVLIAQISTCPYSCSRRAEKVVDWRGGGARLQILLLDVLNII